MAENDNANIHEQLHFMKKEWLNNFYAPSTTYYSNTQDEPKPVPEDSIYTSYPFTKLPKADTRLREELTYLRGVVEAAKSREKGLHRLLLGAIHHAGPKGLRIGQAALFNILPMDPIPEPHFDPNTQEYIYTDGSQPFSDKGRE